MSDTPRLKAHHTGNPDPVVGRWLNCPELAANLERENAALRDKCKWLERELAAVNNEFGSETAYWPEAWKRVAELKDAARVSHAPDVPARGGGQETGGHCTGDDGPCPDPRLCDNLGHCHNVGEARRRRIYVAENQKPSARGDGIWACKCGARNVGGNTNCRKCTGPAPAIANSPQPGGTV